MNRVHINPFPGIDRYCRVASDCHCPQVRRLIKLVHTMTEAQVKKEIGQPEFGLKWKETLDVLPRQHIIVFEKLSKPTETSFRRSLVILVNRHPRRPIPQIISP